MTSWFVSAAGAAGLTFAFETAKRLVSGHEVPLAFASLTVENLPVEKRPQRKSGPHFLLHSVSIWPLPPGVEAPHHQYFLVFLARTSTVAQYPHLDWQPLKWVQEWKYAGGYWVPTRSFAWIAEQS